MKLFCLLCVGLPTPIPDSLLGELRALPGVRINRVSSIVSLYFGGTVEDLHELIASTSWASFHVRVSESRRYQLQ